MYGESLFGEVADIIFVFLISVFLSTIFFIFKRNKSFKGFFAAIFIIFTLIYIYITKKIFSVYSLVAFVSFIYCFYFGIKSNKKLFFKNFFIFLVLLTSVFLLIYNS